MLKFCEVGQSQARDRLLSKYISRGEKIVANCTDLIGEVSALFDAWCNMTAALYHALQDTLGMSLSSNADTYDHNFTNTEFRPLYRPKAKAGAACNRRD